MNGLQQRQLERELGANTLHVDDAIRPGLPEGLAELEVPCCMGAAIYGLERCTCWEPVFDLEQAEDLLTTTSPAVRAECCFDCAYRNGSPEREQGFGDELVDVAGTPGNVFACHQGMRRVIAWRHPALGDREIPAGPGDYQPPIVDGVAYRADGTPADLCAGWDAHRKGLGLDGQAERP